MNPKNFLGKFPNTYTFTKNLAEDIVYQEWIKYQSDGQHFPTAVIRPGIVFTSLREPETGWIDSLNGISGAVLMTAVGLARIYRGDLDASFDITPVDYVANSIITAAWTTNNK